MQMEEIILILTPNANMRWSKSHKNIEFIDIAWKESIILVELPSLKRPLIEAFSSPWSLEFWVEQIHEKYHVSVGLRIFLTKHGMLQWQQTT